MRTPPEIFVYEGDSGVAFAGEEHAIVLVVDVLRASTTLVVLAEKGARRIYVAAEVAEAREAAKLLGRCVLAGERKGLPPQGFDLGNSPVEALGARLLHKRVVFTSTTGAQRLARLAPECPVLVAAPVNAEVATRYAFALATRLAKPLVVLAAGSLARPPVVPTEDWAAAVFLAERLEALGGRLNHSPESLHYSRLLHAKGLPALLEASEHAGRLEKLGLARDVRFAAEVDLFHHVLVRANERLELPGGGELVQLLPVYGKRD